MSNQTSKIDDTLKELLIGILVFGVLAQLGGMFFVKSMSAYSIGLWIGVLLALACAYHIEKDTRYISFRHNGLSLR